jgi:hypothetical protein
VVSYGDWYSVVVGASVIACSVGDGGFSTIVTLLHKNTLVSPSQMRRRHTTC